MDPQSSEFTSLDLILHLSVQSDSSSKSSGEKKVVWLDAALKGGST